MQPRNRDVDLDELQPHPQNYNRHPAEQVRRLTKSLTKFGQVRSVVVWRMFVLAGHGVVEAARLLNWRTVRADVLPDDYPEHLALAYIAADNELAKQGDPDMAQLAAILEESKAADADLLEAIGYSDKEFEELLAKFSVPSDGEWNAAFGGVPTEDRAPFQQMTFTLHDTQAEQVKQAIAAAGRLGDFTDSPNQNSNGNALAFICETFVTEHGQS